MRIVNQFIFGHNALRLALFAIPLGLLVFFGAATGAQDKKYQLIMVEEDGCIWCARWDAEIAPIYPKTEVGSALPLRRIDIRDRLPDDLEFSRPANFTPTFVLVEDGLEFARIEGYPGEDFFWGLVERFAADRGLGTFETDG